MIQTFGSTRGTLSRDEELMFLKACFVELLQFEVLDLNLIGLTPDPIKVGDIDLDDKVFAVLVEEVEIGTAVALEDTVTERLTESVDLPYMIVDLVLS